MASGFRSAFRKEMSLWVGIVAVFFLWTVAAPLVDSPSSPLMGWGLFGVVFCTMLWLSFRVVHHAECLALRVGEPFGTIILTLSVITIEVVMISALMLQGKDAPTLARDTMFSVLMIVLNGMLGVTLLLGGFRHHQQVFNLEGARGFLAVLGCLAILCLVLPSFTTSSPGSSASPLLAAFLICSSLALYGVFLFLQSTSHREFYKQPDLEEPDFDGEHGMHSAG